jgi:hypothetical protein
MRVSELDMFHFLLKIKNEIYKYFFLILIIGTPMKNNKEMKINKNLMNTIGITNFVDSVKYKCCSATFIFKPLKYINCGAIYIFFGGSYC